MAYSKQNFQDGQILSAANLEAMENGIIGAADAKITGEAISKLKNDKLDKTGTAVNSDKLGGQLPEHYATVQSVNQLKDDKLDKTETATDSNKLGGQLPEYYATVQSVNQLKNNKLDKTGAAADSNKLGGQLPEHYATAQSVNQLKNDKLDKTGTATDSNKLGGQLPEHYATVQSVNQLKDDVTAITPDDTEVDGKPWTSKNTVDSLCTPLEAMGNPVQVYPVGNYPLGVKVSWEPTQEGSGDPSPENVRPITGRNAVSVTRCGKNLLKNKGNKTIKGIEWTFDDQGLMSIKGTIANDISDYYFLGKNGENAESFTTHVDLVLSSNYVTNDRNCIFGARTDAGLLQNQGKFNSVSIPSGTRIYGVFMRVLNKTVDYSGIYAQLELGTTATPYEPYIGSTTDIALPETVYGCTLDVGTGVVTVDRAIYTMTGNENFSLNSDGSIRCLIDGQRLPSTMYGDAIYTHYPTGTMSAGSGVLVTQYNGKMLISFNKLLVSEMGYTTETLKEYLQTQYVAGTPVQVCYKIAEPYTIQLSPQQIVALSGVNTLYTDAGTLTVTGREDTRHAINELKNAAPAPTFSVVDGMLRITYDEEVASNMNTIVRPFLSDETGCEINETLEQIRDVMLREKIDAGVEKKDVSFYDYNGTLLHSYTVKEANTLTVLPPILAHEGLVFDGWNWSLEDINKLTRPMNIGAMYHTIDGATRIYIHLEEGHQDITFSICVNGNIVLDWGDGHMEQSPLAGTDLTTPIQIPTHHYTAPGDYVIRLSVNGEAQLNESFSGINSKWLRESTTKIEIGENVTIGTEAFKRYGSLLNIIIPSNITSLGGSAFDGCRSLSSITIPSGITRLEDYVFNDCFSLSTVTVPKSIEYIGESAFDSCYSLQDITLPDLIPVIGACAFQDCRSLSNIIIPARANTIERDAFTGCSLLSNVVVPENLMYIRKRAFKGCRLLSNITISNNSHISEIGEEAFCYCVPLSNITIPSGVTKIQGSTFQDCDALLDITIPNKVESIGALAFFSCSSLSTVTFPNGLVSIDRQAFDFCKEVICFDFTQLSSIPTLLSTNVLGPLRPDCEIRVPASLVDEWKAATNWTRYADHIVGV